MKPACPNCHADVSFETHGGLFSIRCRSCGWLEEGTCNQPLFSSIHSQFLVAKATPPVSAAALKLIREEHPPAQAMSLDVLSKQLTSRNGLWIGYISRHRESELMAKLSAVGVQIEVLPHEEG